MLCFLWLGQFILQIIFSRGPKEAKYQSIPGKAGRLPEKRPIADYETCLETCREVIKEKVF